MIWSDEKDIFTPAQRQGIPPTTPCHAVAPNSQTERHPRRQSHGGGRGGVPALRAAILAAGGRRWNGDHTLGGGDRGVGRFGVLEIGRKLQKRLRISKSSYLQVAKAIQNYWGQTLADLP